MKKKLKWTLNRLGYSINKINSTPLLKDDYLEAIKDTIDLNPTLFDVGANQGQTVKKFLSHYPISEIHSFEPSKICYEALKKNFSNSKSLKLNNNALGSKKEFLNFNEYSWSALNSLLKRSFTKSKIIDTYDVEVTTVDSYCNENNISKISILKTDTEGYELEVLKGAKRMIEQNLIQFIHCEVFFYENYIGQSSFGDLYNYLIRNGYDLVRFYEFEYTTKGYANRTDALFINEKFQQ